MNSLYLEIGKALAQQAVLVYAQTSLNPNVAIGAAVVKTVFDAQNAIARHNTLLSQAVSGSWPDTDPRWDAPLAEQQERMKAVDARLEALR